MWLRQCCAPSLPQTIVEDMEEMFLGLCFSQAVAMKQLDDQGIDSPWTLASLSDEVITAICDMIHRPGRLVSGKTLDRGNQISALATKNLKLAAFMFKTLSTVPRTMISDVSTAHLCYSTGINGSWSRKRQTRSRHPK